MKAITFKNIIITLCLSLLVHAAAGQANSIQTGASRVINIDGNGSGMIFDGIGAVSAGSSSRLLIDYADKSRSDILD